MWAAAGPAAVDSTGGAAARGGQGPRWGLSTLQQARSSRARTWRVQQHVGLVQLVQVRLVKGRLGDRRQLLQQRHPAATRTGRCLSALASTGSHSSQHMDEDVGHSLTTAEATALFLIYTHDGQAMGVMVLATLSTCRHAPRAPGVHGAGAQEPERPDHVGQLLRLEAVPVAQAVEADGLQQLPARVVEQPRKAPHAVCRVLLL